MARLFRVSLLALLCTVSVSCADAAAQAPIVAHVTPAIDWPVIVSGQGEGQSWPFFLRGGSYSVAWKGLLLSKDLCFLGLSLEASGADSLAHEIVAIDIARDSGRTGTSFIRNVEPGRYAVQASDNCAWVATIAPASDGQ